MADNNFRNINSSFPRFAWECSLNRSAVGRRSVPDWVATQSVGTLSGSYYWRSPKHQAATIRT